MAPRKGSIPHNKGKRKHPEPPQQHQTPHNTTPAAALLASPAAADTGIEVSLSALQQVEDKKKQLFSQLKDVERQIFDLETRYLQGCNPNANALIGYEGLRNQAGGSKSTKNSPIAPEERIFSSSSTSTRSTAAALAGATAAAAAAAAAGAPLPPAAAAAIGAAS